jgi:hypothetical protein
LASRTHRSREQAVREERADGPACIHLEILRPGMTHPVEADFGYENTST